MGQIFAACIGFLLNMTKNPWIHFHLKEICFRKDIAKQIFSVGIPSMVTIGLSSATSFCVNDYHWLFNNGYGRIWYLVEIAELLFHANLWFEQWNGANLIV